MNNSMITASVSMGALQQKLDMLADNSPTPIPSVINGKPLCSKIS